MTRLTGEELAARTLRRQFPAVPGQGAERVVALFARLGPIQSQVPRAPFLAAASRLPGTDRETVRGLLEQHRLLRSTSLRGTVHTSVPAQFADADAVSRPRRAQALARGLRGTSVTPEQLTAEVEAYAGPVWRTRADVVAHLRSWLAESGPAPLPERLGDPLIWGHSGLVRRPPDLRWETRTDILHRTATALEPALGPTPVREATARLVRLHLGSYGPAGRADLSFFLGCPLGAVDTALADLAEEVVRVTGPDGEPLLDLAEPDESGPDDPGLRLLGEFDGLLLGYHGHARTRFVDRAALDAVWSSVNGIFSPTVLRNGRLVGTWRPVTRGRQATLEVTMLPGRRPPPEDEFGPAAEATAAALGLGPPRLELRTAS